MSDSRPAVFVFADAPGALVELCGISVVERLLRVLQRLGYIRATVFANSPEVARHLSSHSWARSALTLEVRERADGNELTIAEFNNCLGTSARALIVRGDFYLDARLLRAISARAMASVLMDSKRPSATAPAALIDRAWLQRHDQIDALWPAIESAATGGKIQSLDAAAEPSYVTSMRRDLRPIFLAAPIVTDRPRAEEWILDAAQNGTLDLPALVHAPIETAIVSRLCRTFVTPNQVTFVTFILGLATTILFACGHLWLGAILALIIGVLDGVDGKLARVKVETTELGSWEHALDYAVEVSWWTALAVHFHRAAGSVHAYSCLVLLFASDLIGRLAKRSVKQRLGRNLDDVSKLDRVVRSVAGRRNIYVWIFVFGLLLRHPAVAFIAICCWSAVSAAIHSIRAVQIGLSAKQPRSAQSPPAAD